MSAHDCMVWLVFTVAVVPCCSHVKQSCHQVTHVMDLDVFIACNCQLFNVLDHTISSL